MHRMTLEVASVATFLGIACALFAPTAFSGEPRRTSLGSGVERISAPPSKSTPWSPWVYLGPEEATVSALAVSPLDPDRLLAAVTSSSSLPIAYDAYTTFDGGLEWQPTPFRSPVLDVAFTATGGLLAARVSDIEYSDDDGKTWTQHSINPGKRELSFYREIALRRDGLGDLWARTTSPETAVWRIEDGFSAWHNVTPDMGEGFDVQRLAVSDHQLATVAVAASTSGVVQTRIWVTQDNGESWTVGASGLPPGSVRDMQWQGSRLLVALGSPFIWSPSGLFASDDMGQSFFPLWGGAYPAPVNAFTLDPDDDRRIWIATELDGLYYSADGGLTWSEGIGGTTGMRVPNVLFDTGTDRLWISLEHQGVLLSTDAGQSFEQRSLRLNALPITSVASMNDDPSRLAVSVESGTGGRSQVFMSSDGGLNWDSEDLRFKLWARSVRFDPEGRLYASMHSSPSRNVLLRRELDHTWSEVGFVWRQDELGLMDDVQFGQGAETILLAGMVNPYAGNPRAPVIWRSGDAGLNWERVYSGHSQSDRMSQIERIPRGHGVRLVALERSNFLLQTQTGRLLLSDDDGRRWTPVDAGLPPFSAGALCFDGDTELYLVADVGLDIRLFRSADAGSTWTLTGWQPGHTWQDGRPFTALYCGGNPTTVVVGSRMGEVLVSVDQGESFQPFGEGLKLANDQIYGFHATQAGLYGATYNGLWFHPDLRKPPEHPRGLLATAQHARMRSIVRLAWSGGSESVDVLQGGVRVATVANTGSYSKAIMAFEDADSNTWSVCNAGTNECSAPAVH